MFDFGSALGWCSAGGVCSADSVSCVLTGVDGQGCVRHPGAPWRSGRDSREYAACVCMVPVSFIFVANLF
jgi:hypothetical protein